jgi:putative Ca2+/H+ antiporter (TMEM165/GDT1 family)
MATKDLLTTFILILLATAPSRTTFLLIMLASQGKLKNIFAGAAAAFLTQSIISILLGQILALFPQAIVELVAGTSFIYFSYSFWRQSHKSLDIKLNNRDISAQAVFSIVFMAEFGDVSQLAIAASAAESRSKLSVFILAVTVFWIVTGIALWLGHNLTRLFKPSIIQKTGSLAFFVIGLVLLFRVLQ